MLRAVEPAEAVRRGSVII
jgi:hypothetical protein